jgi:hypothetical protein
LALRGSKKKEGTINRFAKFYGSRRATSQVARYHMNRVHLTGPRWYDGTGSEFDANDTVCDAGGQDAIEIDEWSTFRAGVRNLSMCLAGWRIRAIDHLLLSPL